MNRFQSRHFFQSTGPGWHQLAEHLASLPSWLDHAEKQVGWLVGCSGGADSVALVCLLAEEWRKTHLAAQRRPPLVVVHFNHGLRGDDSHADQRFVGDLAGRLELDFATNDLSQPEYLSCDAVRDEASLRDRRYDFFARIAAEKGCRVISLAHTADDQAETVLHNLLRGTGGSGLAGMRARRPFRDDWVLRRPLIGVRRADLREALNAIDQEWREDVSNDDTTYTRNWIRHAVMPVLQARFPNGPEAICRAASTQAQSQDVLAKLAQQWVDAFVVMNDRVLISPNAKGPSSFMREPAVIVLAMQMVFDQMSWPRGGMSQEHWNRIVDPILGLLGSERLGPDRLSSRKQSIKRLGHLPGNIAIDVEHDCVVLGKR